ncbi:cytochrome P450 [Polyplosphaeria fusca]|uniref:Cytochrome P450 n=1 Tax=Polyplosphaeria fusca TaxID=682080 RepID=A0A9P4RAJ3_9PLEO|nr:cytochrome P450 [Polyplosphaeria fusca]
MQSILSLPYPILIVAAFVTYVILKTVYRLFFHPLAKIPGPKLAAATTLWNAHYDINASGLCKILPELHKKYGPIIRIQPNEVHVAELESFNQVFRVGTPFERVWHNNPFLTGSLQSKETLQETKKRREFLSPFFSKSAILKVEPFLHAQKLSLFLSTLQKTAMSSNGDGGLIDFFLGFRCLTADTIMDYCFQQDLNALAEPEFKSPTVQAFIEGFDLAIAGTFFPTLFNTMSSLIMLLPERVREAQFAPLYGFETMQRLSRERVLWLRANPGKSKMPTLFDGMLAPDEKKGQVTPPLGDMVAEGCLMIAAGTDTTANALGLLLWHVTQNEQVQRRLLEELRREIPNRDDMVDSGALDGPGFEYLRAVVKEGLRLAFGVPGRIIRRTPKEGATFHGLYLPAKTQISSCIYLQNLDPVTFPNPTEYDPDRWLCDAETFKLRDRQMLSFSRGSRGCIGINLALATLHLTVAHLFRRFEITTTGHTTARDMEWNDRFVPVTLGRIKGHVRMRKD